ncbi:MAG: molybdopterin molybdotransferase MoeA [Clostridia bacterium]|nr:molybdopterin molybdotransferase MoeA [Clostridia bacterium]
MLKVVSKSEAVQTVLEATAASTMPTEHIALSAACGRVTAADIVAAEDIPAFDRSTVDGFALCAADTFGASAAIPAQLDIAGEILMGECTPLHLKRGQCAHIATGGMLPQGADAAVMVEHTDSQSGLCLVYQSVSPFENITKKGDDITAGTAAIAQHTLLTPAHIGILAALGVEEVPVLKKPVVAIISTGDEISTAPALGQIRDVNGPLLSAALEAAGCRALYFGALKDDREKITQALAQCLEQADAVLISGGSSAGSRDMTVDILDTLGEVYFHGIAMKPGKPTIFGMARGKAVFGLPGHPLAAYFVYRLIVKPYFDSLLQQAPAAPLFTATLAQNVPSNHGREEYLCVKKEGESIVPIHSKSGIISILSAADGFICVPRDAEGLAAGTQVEVWKL